MKKKPLKNEMHSINIFNTKIKNKFKTDCWCTLHLITAAAKINNACVFLDGKNNSNFFFVDGKSGCFWVGAVVIKNEI